MQVASGIAADWDAMVSVGRVARPHGLDGRVVVNPDTDFVEQRFRVGVTLFVQRGERIEGLQIRDLRYQRRRPIVGFDGIESMTDAERLASADLRVPLAALEPLPDDTFYYHELIGCRVETVDGVVVGVVGALEGDGASHRLVVASVGTEIQIPLVNRICVRVTPADGVITIDPPDGLLALNPPRRRRGSEGVR